MAESGDRRIVFRYFIYSLGFGLLMGVAFPVYAAFFVVYPTPRARLIFTGGSVLAGILVGLASYLIGKLTILRIIDSVADRLGELSRSEGEVGQALDLVSSDSLGRLAANFNAFLAKLGRMLSGLDAVAQRTQEVGFELAANTTETSAASEQISRHMEMIHAETDILLQEVENVSWAREAIRASAATVSANIDRQSESLTVLGASIERTVEDFRSISTVTMDQTKSIVASVGESGRDLEGVAKVAGKIREVSVSVADIGRLTAAIKETAERITILGLNAAIQASHAGPAGKGFAVVAGEIRALSVLASRNSEEIGAGLAAMEGLVADGVRLSESTEARLSTLFEGIGQSAVAIKEVSERFEAFIAKTESMLLAHNALVKVTIDVTESMMGMRDNTDVIENSVTILLDTATHYRQAIDEVAQGISEIAVDVAHLNKVSGINSENTQALKAEVGRFRAG